MGMFDYVRFRSQPESCYQSKEVCDEPTMYLYVVGEVGSTIERHTYDAGSIPKFSGEIVKETLSFVAYEYARGEGGDKKYNVNYMAVAASNGKVIFCQPGNIKANPLPSLYCPVCNECAYVYEFNSQLSCGNCNSKLNLKGA